jgi:cytochrome c-type biogenesis protein CcmH/NrfG
MPAVTMSSRAQADSLIYLTKRSNWASREPGVILVFCIVFLVGLGIVALFAYRKWMAMKAKKQSFETTAA